MAKKKKKAGIPYSEGLSFIPLGGSEQFGVNLNVYMCDGKLLIADCGIGFSDDNMPGVDILLPDPTFLEKNAHNIEAMIVTHAHEDHVGAVAYLWDRLKCPIYCTAFTEKVLRHKFRDRKMRDAPITVVKERSIIKKGDFSVRFIPVAHSIPDTVSLEIDTPYGKVLHSGDWNLDPTPTIGFTTDGDMLKKAGDEGVLAYVGDSTNSTVDGGSKSESECEAGLLNEFKKCKKRIAVSGFSSNIGRVINIARAAKACGRKVCVVGRSFHNMIAIARSLGYMDDICDFISEEDLDTTPRNKIVLIVTGSQGEPRAALSRIARGEFTGVRLERGDTVIYSSRMIPGNERSILSVQNVLIESGINIITPSDADGTIHVSGHPRKDDVMQMYKWLRPNIVVPVHGERTQIRAQAQLAKDHGAQHVIVPHNGAVIHLAPNEPKEVGRVETGILAVERGRIISTDHIAISQRKKAAQDGVVHISFALGSDDGELKGIPVVDTVGILDDDKVNESKQLDKLHDRVVEELGSISNEAILDDDFVEDTIMRAAKKLFWKTLRVNPHIMVHVLRI